MTHGQNAKSKNTFRTSIGGQALIEGILMRGPEKQAIVVRAPEGLVTKVEELKLVRGQVPHPGPAHYPGRGDLFGLYGQGHQGPDVLGGLLPRR